MTDLSNVLDSSSDQRIYGAGPTTALQPQARPLDTFVQPAQVPRNSLFELADSLRGLDSGLEMWFRQQSAAQQLEDRQKGEAAFYQNNQVGFSEGVSRGLIPASASPAFTAAYKQTQGSVAGYALENQFQAAYDTWPGKTSSNPADFDQFARTFIANNMTSTDPMVLRGMLPHINAIMAGGWQQYTQDQHKQVYDGYLNAASAQATSALDAADAQGMVQAQPYTDPETGQVIQEGHPTGVDYNGLWDQFAAIRQKAISVGVRPEDIDPLLMRSAGVGAIMHRDPSYLGLFDQQVPGKGYTYGESPQGAAYKEELTTRLTRMAHQAITEGASQQKQLDEQIKRTYDSQIIQSLAQNPNGPIPEEVLQGAQRYDPTIRVRINDWRKNILEANNTADPQALLSVNRDILNGNPDAVKNAMDAGVFKTPGQLNDAYELQQKVQKNSQAWGQIISSPGAKAIFEAIKTKAGTDTNNPLMPKGENDETLSAEYDFKQQLLNWADANKNAQPQDRETAITQIGKQVLDRITRTPLGGAYPSPMTEGNPYRPDYPTPFPQPPAAKPTDIPPPPMQAPPPVDTSDTPLQAPAARPLSGSMALTPPGPIPANRPQGLPMGAVWNKDGYYQAYPDLRWNEQGKALPTKGDVEQWINDPTQVTPKQANAIDQLAKAQGVGTDAGRLKFFLYTHPQWGQQQQPGPQSFAAPPQGGGIIPASFEEAGRGMDAFVHSALGKLGANDAGNILQRAASSPTSGNFQLSTIKNDPTAASILDQVAKLEANGNYNAVFGNANSQQDLSQYSVGQILQQQRQMAQHGSASTAVGRYQFIRKTLSGLVNELGISPDTKFTPELQDRLALQLLNGRGYADWKAGRMSTDEFGANLSKEWASLPNPATGRSYYAGDGLNAALTTTEDFMGNLAAARTRREI